MRSVRDHTVLDDNEHGQGLLDQSSGLSDVNRLRTPAETVRLNQTQVSMQREKSQVGMQAPLDQEFDNEHSHRVFSVRNRNSVSQAPQVPTQAQNNHPENLNMQDQTEDLMLAPSERGQAEFSAYRMQSNPLQNHQMDEETYSHFMRPQLYHSQANIKRFLDGNKASAQHQREQSVSLSRDEQHFQSPVNQRYHQLNGVQIHPNASANLTSLSHYQGQTPMYPAASPYIMPHQGSGYKNHMHMMSMMSDGPMMALDTPRSTREAPNNQQASLQLQDLPLDENVNNMDDLKLNLQQTNSPISSKFVSPVVSKQLKPPVGHALPNMPDRKSSLLSKFEQKSVNGQFNHNELELSESNPVQAQRRVSKQHRPDFQGLSQTQPDQNGRVFVAEEVDASSNQQRQNDSNLTVAKQESTGEKIEGTKQQELPRQFQEPLDHQSSGLSQRADLATTHMMMDDTQGENTQGAKLSQHYHFKKFSNSSMTQKEEDNYMHSRARPTDNNTNGHEYRSFSNHYQPRAPQSHEPRYDMQRGQVVRMTSGSERQFLDENQSHLPNSDYFDQRRFHQIQKQGSENRPESEQYRNTSGQSRIKSAQTHAMEGEYLNAPDNNQSFLILSAPRIRNKEPAQSPSKLNEEQMEEQRLRDTLKSRKLQMHSSQQSYYQQSKAEGRSPIEDSQNQQFQLQNQQLLPAHAHHRPSSATLNSKMSQNQHRNNLKVTNSFFNSPQTKDQPPKSQNQFTDSESRYQASNYVHGQPIHPRYPHSHQMPMPPPPHFVGPPMNPMYGQPWPPYGHPPPFPQGPPMHSCSPMPPPMQHPGYPPMWHPHMMHPYGPPPQGHENSICQCPGCQQNRQAHFLADNPSNQAESKSADQDYQEDQESEHLQTPHEQMHSHQHPHPFYHSFGGSPWTGGVPPPYSGPPGPFYGPHPFFMGPQPNFMPYPPGYQMAILHNESNKSDNSPGEPSEQVSQFQAPPSKPRVTQQLTEHPQETSQSMQQPLRQHTEMKPNTVHSQASYSEAQSHSQGVWSSKNNTIHKKDSKFNEKYAQRMNRALQEQNVVASPSRFQMSKSNVHNILPNLSPKAFTHKEVLTSGNTIRQNNEPVEEEALAVYEDQKIRAGHKRTHGQNQQNSSVDTDSPIRLNLIKAQKTPETQEHMLQSMQQMHQRAHDLRQPMKRANAAISSESPSMYPLQENPTAQLESGGSYGSQVPYQQHSGPKRGSNSHEEEGPHPLSNNMALELKDQESFAAYTRHMNSLKQTTSSGELTKSANNQKSNQKVLSGQHSRELPAESCQANMAFMSQNQPRNSVRQALNALQMDSGEHSKSSQRPSQKHSGDNSSSMKAYGHPHMLVGQGSSQQKALVKDGTQPVGKSAQSRLSMQAGLPQPVNRRHPMSLTHEQSFGPEAQHMVDNSEVSLQRSRQESVVSAEQNLSQMKDNSTSNGLRLMHQHSNNSASSPAPSFKPCYCKKTGCFKLYCDCLKAGQLCTDLCKCTGCKNREPNEKRDKLLAYHKAKMDYSSPFKPVLDHDGQLSPTRGCGCKKSGCRKNYCECFQKGLPCTSHCSCGPGCKNTHQNRLMDNSSQMQVSKTAKKEEEVSPESRTISMAPSQTSSFHTPSQSQRARTRALQYHTLEDFSLNPVVIESQSQEQDLTKKMINGQIANVTVSQMKNYADKMKQITPLNDQKEQLQEQSPTAKSLMSGELFPPFQLKKQSSGAQASRQSPQKQPGRKAGSRSGRGSARKQTEKR